MTTSSYTAILDRLRLVLRRYNIVRTAEAFLAAFGVFAVFLILFSLLESALYMPPAVKMPLFLFIAGVLPAVFAAFFIVNIYLKRPGTDDLSRLVEKAYPGLGDRLISAVQLGRLDDRELHGQSHALVDALLERVERETREFDPSRAVPLRRLMLPGRIAYGAAVVFLLLLAVLPGRFGGGVFRLADFSTAYVSPDDVTIYILDRNDSIIRGDTFSAPGILSGWRFEPLTVFYRWGDSRTWTAKPVDVDRKTGKFTVTIEKPRVSFFYYLETGSASTPRFRVGVIERPVVETVDVTLSYPAYTGLGTVRKDDNDGNIRALVGTDVTVSVRANKTLETMTVHWSDSTTVECAVDGNMGTFAFIVDKTLDYHIDITDTLGIENTNPIQYRVTCLVDEHPEAAIASPPPDVVLPLSLKVPIVYRARDDYGLSAVSLRYKLPYEEGKREIPLKSGALGRTIEDVHVWDMSALSLLPDDAVTYEIVVMDNDTVNGPKVGVSDTGTLRMPSMTDFLSDTMESQEQGIDQLRDMSSRAAEENAPLDEVRRNVINGKNLDWSDRNALEGAKSEAERMQKELKELSESIKSTSERLSDEDMAAIETLEQYRKISELMDDIVDGDLKRAVQQLTQVSIDLDPAAVKKAVEQHKVTAAEMKKKLDRIIALLEQVKAIQRFEIAKRLVEDIAAEQAGLASRFEENPEDESLRREQEKLAAEMDKLEKELADMADELGEKFDLNTDEFKKHVESLEIADTMENTARSMQTGSKERTKDKLSELNTMLSGLMMQMDQLGAAMQDSNTEEMKRRLFRALDDLLAVSEKQERLIAEIDRADTNSVRGDEIARRQLEVIDAFGKARATLEHFGEIAVEVSAVLDHLMTIVAVSMEAAVNTFATGNTVKGANIAENALKDLNNSIHILTMFFSGGEGGGKGMPGDLMQQLQQIANGQLSLQMQLGQAGSEELMMQLAAEQQKLAEMLSELGRKIANDPRLKEMLEKLSEDMGDTSRMMRRNERRELVERKQLDIYRRLLDARRSRREKDQTDERKSWTAKRNESRGADELARDLGEKKRDLNERLKQAMQDDFDTEYLRLIRRYFESMLRDYDTTVPEEGGGGAR